MVLILFSRGKSLGTYIRGPNKRQNSLFIKQLKHVSIIGGYRTAQFYYITLPISFILPLLYQKCIFCFSSGTLTVVTSEEYNK